MIAARQIISLFWPALAVVGLTMIFGRFFCGWVCPLGTLLDYFHRIVSGPLSLWERVCGLRRQAARPTTEDPRRLESPPRSLSGRATRYFLLIAVLLAAVFAFPLVGYVDPFSLLGARNDSLGRSAALSRSGCLLRLGRRRLGHERFAAVGEETPAPVPPDGVSPGRSVGGASGDYFCPRIGGPPVLVPVSLSGRGPVRPAGPPVAGKTDSGQGLQGVRPVRGRLPHGRPRSDRGPNA